LPELRASDEKGVFETQGSGRSSKDKVPQKDAEDIPLLVLPAMQTEI
jgi:hypothetical protein